MSTIDAIIKRLGYGRSASLYRLDCNGSSGVPGKINQRLMEELRPYAVYMTDNSIQIAFFDDLRQRNDYQDTLNKIWNARIPVVFSDEGNTIKIYNGREADISKLKVRLKELKELGSDRCNEDDEYSIWKIRQTIAHLVPKRKKKTQLNEYLINNITEITNMLKEDYSVSTATRTVLRVLFIRYLIDRGISLDYSIIDDIRGVENGCQIIDRLLHSKEEYYRLVEHLKTKFNGNLFELLPNEKEEMTDDALEALRRFLSGKEMLDSGQLMLFPIYDFNIIPIELISNVYEILLGEEKRNDDKAYYTPEFLADGIIERIMETMPAPSKSCRVIDPSCGSGIFLIKAARHIIEHFISERPEEYSNDDIVQLVKNNIFGIDKNDEAVDVTIFSLYITILEYSKLTSVSDLKLPLLKGCNIWTGDFFEIEHTGLGDNKYRYILGNPPWGKVDQNEYLNFCRKVGIDIPGKDISCAFLIKTLELCDDETQCCMIIPSKTLYKRRNRSVSFRKYFLENAGVDFVFETAAARKELFEDANAPAAIIAYRKSKGDRERIIEHTTVKNSTFLKSLGYIMIEPDDVKYVRQGQLMQNDHMWKIIAYGSYWDYKTIEELKHKYKTIGDILEENSFICAAGVQDRNGDANDASFLQGKKLLNSKSSIDHFFLNESDFVNFDKPFVHRPRREENFEAPLVLFRKGVDTNDYSIKAVFTDHGYIYKDAIYGISGDKECADIMYNMCGLLNSSFYAYLNLMTASSVGIEREQVFLDEIKYYPYSFSSDLVSISKQLHKRMDEESKRKLKTQLDECVLDMFGLKDNAFVNYALNVQIPLLNNTLRFSKAQEKDIVEYALYFADIWDDYFGGSKIHYSIKVYPSIHDCFAALEYELHTGGKPSCKEPEIVNELDSELLEFAVYQMNGSVFQTKNIVNYTDSSFVILKPIDKKNWHVSAAIRDAQNIINSILLEEDAPC